MDKIWICGYKWEDGGQNYKNAPESAKRLLTKQNFTSTSGFAYKKRVAIFQNYSLFSTLIFYQSQKIIKNPQCLFSK